MDIGKRLFGILFRAVESICSEKMFHPVSPPLYATGDWMRLEMGRGIALGPWLIVCFGWLYMTDIQIPARYECTQS